MMMKTVKIHLSNLTKGKGSPTLYEVIMSRHSGVVIYTAPLYTVYLSPYRFDDAIEETPKFNNYLVVNNEYDTIESVEDLLPNAIYMAKQLSTTLDSHLNPELPTPEQRH